jgi:hypothetical protein
MTSEKLSDLQMPFYMFYAWGWARCFGTDEWVLRAANLPWFIGGVLAFSVSFRGSSRLFAALIATLSSFAWFYLDEARPYAMQLGASLCIAAALRHLHATAVLNELGAGRVWAFCVSVGVLAGTSLLAVFWSGAALAILFAALGWSRVIAMMKAARLAWIALAAWFVCLAAYYGWTLSVGARASAAGATSLQNALFIVYELLGFGGLGPGRLEIREAGLAAFHSHWLALGLHGGFAAAVIAWGTAHFWQQDRVRLAMVGTVVTGTLVGLLGVGWWFHFRLLGRHCAPAFVAVVLLLVAGAEQAWRHRERWRKYVVLGFLLVALASCLSARWALRHQKDDYRSAVAFAKNALAHGHRVWWSADRSGAEVYGLPVNAAAEATPSSAWWIANPTSQMLASARAPDYIVASKPDLYDTQEALAAYVAQERFEVTTRLTAFRIWERRR